MSESLPSHPENREKRERRPLRVQMDSYAGNPDHPDYNEDALLGDAFRLQTEMAAIPNVPVNQEVGGERILKKYAKMEADALPLLQKLNVFGVFDGLGGAGIGRGLYASRIASAEAARTLATELEADDQHEEMTLIALQDALEAARDGLTTERLEKKELEGIATTGTLFRLLETEDDTYSLAFAHIGDSRMYVFEAATETLRQVTEDHGVLSEALKTGIVSQEEHDFISSAKHEDEFDSPVRQKLLNIFLARNIVRKTISPMKDVQPQTGVVRGLKEGDKVLTFSDGVHDNLTDAEIAALMRDGASISDVVRMAAERSQEGILRSKPDDITGVIVEIPPRAESNKDVSGEKTEKDKAVANGEAALDEALNEKRLLEMHHHAVESGNIMKIKGGVKAVIKYGGSDKIERHLRNARIRALTAELDLGALRLDAAGEQATGKSLDALRRRMAETRAERDVHIKERNERELYMDRHNIRKAHADLNSIAELTKIAEALAAEPSPSPTTPKRKSWFKWLGF